MESLAGVKNLTFDLIGTCFDWHTPVSRTLKAHASAHPTTLGSLAATFWDDFAHEWRLEFFAHLGRLASEEQVRPMNEVYQHTLNALLDRHNIKDWNASEQADLIKSWEMMEAWADTPLGIDALRRKYTVISLTNGSTRTIIDAFKRNSVQMDAILTSDVIGTFKPNPFVYRTALKALQCEQAPGEVAMVASHSYDLEAAAKLGFRTIYIIRHTEDIGLDPARLNKFDLVINEGGIAELARRLETV